MLSGCLLRQKQDSVSPGRQGADTWPAYVLWGAINVLSRECRSRPRAHTKELTADGRHRRLHPFLHPGVLAAKLNSAGPGTHTALQGIMKLVWQTGRRRCREQLAQITVRRGGTGI